MVDWIACPIWWIRTKCSLTNLWLGFSLPGPHSLHWPTLHSKTFFDLLLHYLSMPLPHIWFVSAPYLSIKDLALVSPIAAMLHASSPFIKSFLNVKTGFLLDISPFIAVVHFLTVQHEFLWSSQGFAPLSSLFFPNYLMASVIVVQASFIPLARYVTW